MLLSQGRFWRASLAKGEDAVSLATLREGLAADEAELRDLRIEVPLARWGTVLKHVRSDRKLLGGVLLDFASHKDYVSTAVASDRLLGELQRIVLESTAALAECGAVTVTPARGGEDEA